MHSLFYAQFSLPHLVLTFTNTNQMSIVPIIEAKIPPLRYGMTFHRNHLSKHCFCPPGAIFILKSFKDLALDNK